MKMSQLFTGGAVAALAGALALTATPALAQDDERRGWRTTPRESNSSAGAERPATRAERPAIRTQQRAPQRAERAARPQVAAPPPIERRAQVMQQRSTRDANRADREQNRATRGGWNAGNAPVLRSERNPTYVDPNRNVNSGDGDRNRRDNDRWRDGRRDNDRDRRDGRRDHDRDWRDGDRGSYRDGYRDARRDYHRWDRRWRDNHRYNWYSYRDYNRHLYSAGRYYAPYRNYHYRRLSIGIFLDSLFYSNRYWINDPWQYRLPDVYGPYRWVRYYDDALLVDVHRGEVVDVIYDFFW